MVYPKDESSKSAMINLKKDYEWLNQLAKKYEDYEEDRNLRGWLTICLLNQEYDVMSMTFESFIVTYMVKSEVFNVIKLRVNNDEEEERTILINKHIMKNFGVSTLKELNENTLCTVCDLCPLIDDLESDILGHKKLDDAWSERKLTVS